MLAGVTRDTDGQAFPSGGQGMGRPATRTEVVDPGMVALLRQQFGTTRCAYRNLGLDGRVGFDTFRRVWQGKPVSVGVSRAVEEGWIRHVAELKVGRQVA